MKLGIAVFLMGIVLWIGSGPTDYWLHTSGAQRVAHLAAVVAGGAATYFIALWLLGFRPSQFSQRGVE